METAAMRVLAIPELLDIVIGYTQVCCTCSIAAQRGVNKLWNETTLARMAFHLCIKGPAATFRCSRSTALLDAITQPLDQSGLYRHTKSVRIHSTEDLQHASTLSVLAACTSLKTVVVNATAVLSWASLLRAPKNSIDSLQILLGPSQPCATDFSALALIVRNLVSLKITLDSEDYIEDECWSSFVAILQEAPSQLKELSIDMLTDDLPYVEVRTAIISNIARFHHLRIMSISDSCDALDGLDGLLDNLPDCLEHLRVYSSANTVLGLLARLAGPSFLPELIGVDITCNHWYRTGLMITEDHVDRAIAGLKQRKRVERINYDQLNGLINVDIPPHVWTGDIDIGSENSLQEYYIDDEDEDPVEEDDGERDSSAPSDGEEDQKSEESDADSEDDKDPDLYQGALPSTEYEGYYDLELPRGDDDDSEEERVEDELPESSIELEPEYLDDLEDYESA